MQSAALKRSTYRRKYVKYLNIRVNTDRNICMEQEREVYHLQVHRTIYNTRLYYEDNT